MLFSTVIPTHHRPQQLEMLLNSLVNQVLDKNDFEVIVVHTNEDLSLPLFSKFKDSLNLRFMEIENDQFQGRSASAKRNYGVKNANGQWIAFIDDDCIADSHWLSNAAGYTKQDIDGIEGYVDIPTPQYKTLTYKGIRRLSDPKGYQTCNMIYKKTSFENIGGFDLNFPFYLEDTDLGWSIIENGGTIIFAKDVIASHPVPASEPYRLITGAFRTSKLVYLFKKHPDLYTYSRMDAFRTSYKIYICAYICFFAAVFGSLEISPFIVLLGIFLLLTAHLLKMFWKCQFTARELLLTACYTLVVPVISLFALLKGIFQYRVIPPL